MPFLRDILVAYFDGILVALFEVHQFRNILVVLGTLLFLRDIMSIVAPETFYLMGRSTL